MLFMKNIPLAQQRVLIRADLNVPIQDGKIADDSRIRAALAAIEFALQQQAAVMVLSHLGRPKEGQFDEENSLRPVAEHLSKLLKRPVRLIKDWLDGVEVAFGEVMLCENVRFNRGENADDEALAKKMAKLCDVFVMDAFGTAHRAQASTHAIAKFAPIACAGPLLAAEVDALQKALLHPAKPLIAIVGGSKVSSKLEVLESLADKVDQLIVGGGIANTFIAAAGFNVGASLCEKELIETAKRIQNKTHIPLPVDVVVASAFAPDANARVTTLNDIADNEMILDIGPQSAEQFAQLIQKAGTVVWNGPVGVFEWPAFANGTQKIAHAIADSTAFSIAGGGDTLSAIHQFEVAEKISYISTGGGAFLEFLEGKTLPALAVLQERAVKKNN